ncbi:MAG: peptide MFS transporter [Bacteroidota bacterium]
MESTLDQIRDFKGRYPRQLWALFFSEMWERFCFYGMRGMLTFFMVHQLMMDEKAANLQYGATQAWVYAFTFIGGLFADKILGFRKSLFWGGLLMITGSVILAIDPKEFFFLGIAFNVVGTGFFKPNISSMVGQLYNQGDSRRDAGFSLFYAGINIGALLGGYLCIAIGKHELFESIIPEGFSWNVAFGLAALVMTISLLTFSNTRKSMGPIGLSPLPDSAHKTISAKDALVYALGLVSIPIIMVMVANTRYTDYFMYAIGPFSLAYLVYELTSCTKDEVKKIIAAMFFIVFSIVFWAIYEQAGGSLSLYAADHLNSNFLGLVKLDPNGVNNSANAAFVILFAAIAGSLWVALSKRKMEPNTVVKFGLGFLFLGAGFMLFFTGRFFADQNGISSLDVFTLAYLVITFGELCLSPIGLSIMTKLAPALLQGYMMGMWFLASAYGQYVAGLFGASISPEASATPIEKLNVYTQGYYDFAWYAIIAGIVLIAISPIIRRLMGDVK